MKQFLLFIAFLFAAAIASAQCEPIFDFGDEPWGVAPDTITNLNEGEINSFYTQQIDVLVPVNGDPFGAPFPVEVDSASIVNVIGLPEGLSFACNSPLTTPCTYLGGDQGCGIISGIPTEAGVFDLTISVMAYSQIVNLPVFVEGYEIVISDPLSDGIQDRSSDFNLFPNPTSTSFDLSFDYKQTENILVTIYDIVGKEALSFSRLAQPGKNTFTVPVENLKEGTYIVRLDGMNLSATKRLVVNK